MAMQLRAVSAKELCARRALKAISFAAADGAEGSCAGGDGDARKHAPALFNHKREQTSQKQSDKLAAEYAKAMAVFDKYSVPGRATPTLAVARAPSEAELSCGAARVSARTT
eukprot:3209595-Pleurochrysis_carterae.AAC.1